MNNIIELRNISFSYSSDSLVKDTALANVSLSFSQGEFIGIAGHTGSGKSTVAQIIAGLITPCEGTVLIDGIEMTDYKQAARELRKRVGIVFQYPEHQLFEETVYKDIAFGPKNKGLSDEETDKCVRKAARLADLDEKLFDESPFELSGGQKRRVAIAGVLATEPSVLILDEPAAGLDPEGRERLARQLHRICEEENTTIILISHSMEELAENADRIIILNHGVKFKDADISEVFTDENSLKQLGLEMPCVTQIVSMLRAAKIDIKQNVFNIDDAADAIIDCWRRGK